MLSGKRENLTTDSIFEGRTENTFAKRIPGKDFGFEENARKMYGRLTEWEVGCDTRQGRCTQCMSHQRLWL